MSHAKRKADNGQGIKTSLVLLFAFALSFSNDDNKLVFTPARTNNNSNKVIIIIITLHLDDDKETRISIILGCHSDFDRRSPFGV